jgi:4a-hydroxytetrahydrobiopterin dehydratase
LEKIDWARKIKEEFLHREILFRDFLEALSIMTAVAFVAEKLAHHPNWKIAYNKQVIDLATNHAGGLTKKDFDSGKAIDALLKKHL